MHSAFGSIDIVYKTILAVAVSIIMLESHFHIDIILCSFKI